MMHCLQHSGDFLADDCNACHAYDPNSVQRRPGGPLLQKGRAMDRRTFLKGTGATAIGAGMLPFLKVLPASAAPGGVAVVAISQTINSLDIHRSGTNRPS